MRNVQKYKGFTLFETILAMSIISLVSVGAIYMLFLSLNLRDLSSATAKTEEALRVFDKTLRQATLNSKNVTGGGTNVFLQSASECWSFVFDPVLQNLRYSKQTQSGCIPIANPSTLFFPLSIKINSINFYFTSLETGGRQIGVNGSISAVLPFDTYQTAFSNTYTNLVD